MSDIASKLVELDLSRISDYNMWCNTSFLSTGHVSLCFCFFCFFSLFFCSLRWFSSHLGDFISCGFMVEVPLHLTLLSNTLERTSGKKGSQVSGVKILNGNNILFQSEKGYWWPCLHLGFTSVSGDPITSCQPRQIYTMSWLASQMRFLWPL